jgi:hypothetical protein
MFDTILKNCYDSFVMIKEKLMKPTSEMYKTLTTTEKAEIQRYGMTVKAMVDAIEIAMIEGDRSPEQIARTMLVDVGNMVGNDPDDMFEARKDINRVIYILQNFCSKQETAITILSTKADLAIIDGDVETLIDVLKQAKNLIHFQEETV